MDILDELKSLINKLEEENIDYALCGGLAMAIYALPRATLDIDILITPNLLEKINKNTEKEYSLTIKLVRQNISED